MQSPQPHFDVKSPGPDAKEQKGVKRGVETDFHENEQKKKARIPEEPSRAVYFGNLHPETNYHVVCQLASFFGPIESVKLVPEKGCVFVNYTKQESAQACMNACTPDKPFVIFGNNLRVGWAKATPIPQDLQQAIEAGGATRAVFVGGIGPSINEQMLYEFFMKYGEIESVHKIREKNIAFINFTSVRAALQAKTEQNEKEVYGRRINVNFAKEKGLPPPLVAGQKPQRKLPPAAALAAAVNPMGPGMAPASPGFGAGTMRGVYLGNVPAETSFADIFKVANRFGAVESTKLLPEKHCAFVNFVEDRSAVTFLQSVKLQPLVMNGVELKIGVAKSTPLHGPIVDHIRKGATRNLFVGNLDPSIQEKDLKDLFAPHCNGEFDTVVIMRDKGIAFVNLTSISAAVFAREKTQGAVLAGKPIKVNFAKEKVFFG